MHQYTLYRHIHGWSGCQEWATFWFTTQSKILLLDKLSSCVIHRETLASQKTSPEYNSALQDVIEIINHTKLHALNSHLLAQPCEEMNALICSCTQK